MWNPCLAKQEKLPQFETRYLRYREKRSEVRPLVAIQGKDEPTRKPKSIFIMQAFHGVQTQEKKGMKRERK